MKTITKITNVLFIIRDTILNILAEVFKFILIPIAIVLIIATLTKLYLVFDEDNNNTISQKEYEEVVIESSSVEEENKKTKDIQLFISDPKIIKEKKDFFGLDFSKLDGVSAVNVGDTIVYELFYVGDVHTFNLTPGHIGLYNFTGEISIHKSGQKAYLVISNIQAPYSVDTIFVTINGGTAISQTGEMVDGARTKEIKIYHNDFIRFVLWVLPNNGSDLITFTVTIAGVIISSSIPKRKKSETKTIFKNKNYIQVRHKHYYNHLHTYSGKKNNK